MANFQIETEHMSTDGLIPSRRISIGKKTVRTPARAIPIHRAQDGETVHPDSRQVCEIHRQIDAKRLAKERQGRSEPITEKLQKDAEAAPDDDLVFLFLTYTDGARISEYEAEQIVDFMAEFSDVVTVPMMPDLRDMVDPEAGLEDEAFRTYVRSAKRIIETARKKHPNMPIMGVLPTLERDHVQDLFETYLEKEIRAFYVNFNRGKATAGTKVDLLRPLMHQIGREDLQDAVFFYAINLRSGHHDQSLGGAPAEDVSAISLGFDIIGENHVGLNLPEEVIEEMMDEAENEPETFTLFDRERFLHREVPLDRLAEEFPQKSEFDPDEIVERVRGNDRRRRRLEKLVTAEQISLALKELQELGRDDIFRDLANKPGVSTQAVTLAQELREVYDDGANQSSLDDFS